MVLITEQLIRKRAEHNEGLIYSLEEISLHQSDIEKIENIDKWCRDLKILYLQSNLIDKIENVSKLKQMEYLNLALNNVQKVENLEKCENLTKLDLTVNFIADLTSIESLRANVFLQEIYFTGNPCTKFEHYREFVVATLPTIQRLDGTEITTTERLEALQNLKSIRKSIVNQQEDYFIQERRKKEGKGGRWYTDIGGETQSSVVIEDVTGLSEEEKNKKNKEYWNTPTDHTPETRKEIHRKLEADRAAVEEQRKGVRTNKVPKRETVLERDGQRMNLNQAKWPFKLDDSSDPNNIVLEIGIPKHLSTQGIDVDVQPTYVKCVAEGRTLQLVLTAEVSPDTSTCQRSELTGGLVITMPTSQQTIVPSKLKKRSTFKEENSKFSPKQSSYLEFDNKSKNSDLDFSKIVSNNSTKALPSSVKRETAHEKSVSSDFVDDLDVPPLI